jgi:hypothetical protein
MRKLTVDRPGQLPVKEGGKVEGGLNEGVVRGEKRSKARQMERYSVLLWGNQVIRSPPWILIAQQWIQVVELVNKTHSACIDRTLPLVGIFNQSGYDRPGCR